MGQLDVTPSIDPAHLRVCTQRVLRDLRALERIIDEGMIETGTRRIGMEQEMFLADRGRRPAPVSMEVLERIDDPHFTTELARFNLECNLDPIVFTGDCFRRLETRLCELIRKARDAAALFDAEVILTGILPTLRQTDLDLRNMAPVPRYFALNAGLRHLRGDEFALRVGGLDEINVKHDSVMLEACNTSSQFHLQVTPEEFARVYNIAQAVAGPVLACAVNSPFLFGKRLWHETRIAVFAQSIDTRMPAHHVQDRSARVSFGTAWVKESILEIYRDDLARFRVFLSQEEGEDVDPFVELAEGHAPRLGALTLHNGTVYRWNRPCYGVHEGRPHLRIENRVLPSGPTVTDEIANAALWYGVVTGLASEVGDVSTMMEFDTARANFAQAVRLGLDAHQIWIDGRKYHSADLVHEVLLPLARRGLRERNVDAADVDHYLGVMERRVKSGQTGAEWMLRSYASMHDEGTPFERLRALVAGMSIREQEGRPVHEWTLAEIGEAGGWKHNFERVGQFMTTDLFTVHEDEVVDLTANVMAWRKIRHVPVEDDDHRLVGLVSFRSLLPSIAQPGAEGAPRPVAVREIMQTSPTTVTPDTPTLEAIGTMRREGIACLPVIKNGRLVGIVSEHDFMVIAGRLLQEREAGEKEG